RSSDLHTLPLEALAAALTEHGLPVRMFGGALPVESLVAAVRRTGPAVVGLWAQSRTTASRPLAQHVAAMEWGVRGARRKAAVLTLGPGWAGQGVSGLARTAGLAEAGALTRSPTQCRRRPALDVPAAQGPALPRPGITRSLTQGCRSPAREVPAVVAPGLHRPGVIRWADGTRTLPARRRPDGPHGGAHGRRPPPKPGRHRTDPALPGVPCPCGRRAPGARRGPAVPGRARVRAHPTAPHPPKRARTEPVRPPLGRRRPPYASRPPTRSDR